MEASVSVHRYIMDDVMRQWAEYDSNKDDYVTWDEFRAATFGDHQGDQPLLSGLHVLLCLSLQTTMTYTTAIGS